MKKPERKVSKIKKTKSKPERKTSGETIIGITEEITDAIAKSGEMLDAIGDGISIVDRAFKVLYENQVHRDTMGDHVGEHCYKAYTKRQGVCGGCPVALTFNDGKFHTVQRELQTDEETRYVEITASPLKDSTGKIMAGIEVVRDITERKRIEEALRESEDRYKTLVETSLVGVWHITLDGYTIYINPAMCAMLEIEKAEDLEGMTYHSFFTPESLVVIQRERSKRPKGIASSYEVEIVGKRGKKSNVVITGAPIFGADGKLYSYIGTFTDITESKQAQEALRESEQKLRNIIEHSNEMYYVHDTNHVLSYASPQSLQILGYTPDEMMIKWTKLATENPINEIGMEITEKALKTGGKQPPYLLELYKKDRSKVLLEIDESPIIDDKGNVIGIVGAARDVTERVKAEESLKKSEEQIRMLLDSTAEAIYGQDLDGKCTFVNVACIRILGYDNETELLGKNIHELVHYKHSDGSPYPLERCRIYTSSKNDKRIHVDSEVFWRADGTSFPVEYRSYPIEEKGKVIGAVVTFLDITDRKRTEEEIHGRVKELEDFYDMAVGREIRMVQLKEEIEKLKEELEKYKMQ